MKLSVSVHAWACSLLGVLISGTILAETRAFPHFPQGGITPSSALTTDELHREAFLNMASDADLLTKATKKEDPTSKANVSIFGTIVNNQGTPLCALVLANGQFMFSCSPNGTWSLTVPQDSSGQVTLFGFADAHFPYRLTFGGSGGRYDMLLNSANTVITPPPPVQNATITFTIEDACNNGIRINYKFYDFTNNLVWPSSTTHYYTQYYGARYTHNLSCRVGASVCYGGRSGNIYWGVDVDGSKYCDACCISCSQGNSLSRRLTC